MDPNASISHLISSKTTRDSFEKTIDSAVQAKNGGRVYVNLTQGTLSTDKTAGAVKVPLQALQAAYLNLTDQDGIRREDVYKSKTWQNLPMASQKNATFTDIFRTSKGLDKTYTKHQEKLQEKLSDHAWDVPIHFIGSVVHSKMQYVGENGKELDATAYSKEMYTIPNVIVEKDVKGNAVLDKEGNPKLKTLLPGLPSEIHVYQNVLGKTYNEWEKQLDAPNSVQRFDEFVQVKLSDRKDMRFTSEIRKNNVLYLNEDQLEKTRMTVNDDGTLMQVGLSSETNKPAQLPDSNSYAFVLGKGSNRMDDSSKSLYLAKKVISTEGRINHSSFFRGGKVESAGIITIKEGKITLIEPSSGHYKPTDAEMAATLTYLKDILPKNDFEAIQIHVENGHPPVPAQVWLDDRQTI